MRPAKNDQEIAQIAFYLAKPAFTFDSVIEKDAELHKRTAFRQHDFQADGIDCRFIYFEAQNSKSNPPWLEFVNAQLGAAGPVTFKATSRNANGILLVVVDGHVLVAAFWTECKLSLGSERARAGLWHQGGDEPVWK